MHAHRHVKNSLRMSTVCLKPACTIMQKCKWYFKITLFPTVLDSATDTRLTSDNAHTKAAGRPQFPPATKPSKVMSGGGSSEGSGGSEEGAGGDGRGQQRRRRGRQRRERVGQPVAATGRAAVIAAVRAAAVRAEVVRVVRIVAVRAAAVRTAAAEREAAAAAAATAGAGMVAVVREVVPAAPIATPGERYIQSTYTYTTKNLEGICPAP